MQATGQFNRQITTILHGLQTAFFIITTIARVNPGIYLAIVFCQPGKKVGIFTLFFNVSINHAHNTMSRVTVNDASST